MDKKRASNSETNLRYIMQREHSNLMGNVHGGEMMKIMDNTAGIVAYRHSHAHRVVTASVREMEFHMPIQVGSIVTSEGRLMHVGSSSMEIKVEAWVEDIKSYEPKFKAITAYFIMVALNEKGKPMKVPEIRFESEQDQALYEEGKQRYEAKNKKRE